MLLLICKKWSKLILHGERKKLILHRKINTKQMKNKRNHICKLGVRNLHKHLSQSQQGQLISHCYDIPLIFTRREHEDSFCFAASFSFFNLQENTILG